MFFLKLLFELFVLFVFILVLIFVFVVVLVLVSLGVVVRLGFRHLPTRQLGVIRQRLQYERVIGVQLGGDQFLLDRKSVV